MNDTTSRRCLPRARCRDFRNCPICARIRQAQIADAAERLQAHAGRLTWACLKPVENGADALARARAAFLRAHDPAGAVWTVELSPQTGALHCNVLLPNAEPKRIRLARVWQAPIEGDVRQVAAYIAKRDQIPPRELYDGRLYGTAGPLWQWLAGGDAPPIVAAAKTQYDIDPAPLSTNSGVSQDLFVANRRPEWSDYREIAARRLPDIMRAVPIFRPKPAKAADMGTTTVKPRAYYRPVLNSKRVRWLTGTLAAWEKDWKPKSAR